MRHKVIYLLKQSISQIKAMRKPLMINMACRPRHFSGTDVYQSSAPEAPHFPARQIIHFGDCVFRLWYNFVSILTYNFSIVLYEEPQYPHFYDFRIFAHVLSSQNNLSLSFEKPGCLN